MKLLLHLKILNLCTLAPLSTNKDYPNYKIDKKTAKVDDKLPFKVKVYKCAMV